MESHYHLLDSIVTLAYRDTSNNAIRFGLLHFAHVFGHQISAQAKANGNNATLLILLMQMLHHGSKIISVAIGKYACRCHLYGT